MEIAEFRQEVDGAIARGDASGAARLLAAAWESDPGSALAGFVASRYDRIAGRLVLLRQLPSALAILKQMSRQSGVPASPMVEHGEVLRAGR